MGVSSETWSRPKLTQYFNEILRDRCITAGYSHPRWTSPQVTSQGADPHKDTTNKPGTFNYAVSAGNFEQGVLWIESHRGTTTAQIKE